MPQLTTALETRGPIGYGTHIEFVNIEESLEPVVNIVLPAGVLALNPYVVTAENPISKTVTQTCLMSVELFTATDARMFQVLRGKIRTRGNFRLEVVDWPAQGINTSAHFTLESVGTLTGRVRDKTADLRDTLTRDGSVWRGSATEPRDHKTRWRRVSMRETVCAL